MKKSMPLKSRNKQIENKRAWTKRSLLCLEQQNPVHSNCIGSISWLEVSRFPAYWRDKGQSLTALFFNNLVVSIYEVYTTDKSQTAPYNIIGLKSAIEAKLGND